MPHISDFKIWFKQTYQEGSYNFVLPIQYSLLCTENLLHSRYSTVNFVCLSYITHLEYLEHKQCVKQPDHAYCTTKVAVSSVIQDWIAKYNAR